jgi:hypothetical protein
MSHELAEKVGGLASRVNNLAVHHTGHESRTLLELQDQLAKVRLVAIVKELRAEQAEYRAAVQGLNEAIASVGEATTRIENVAHVIHLVTKAVELAEKAVKSTAA